MYWIALSVPSCSPVRKSPYWSSDYESYAGGPHIRRIWGFKLPPPQRSKITKRRSQFSLRLYQKVGPDFLLYKSCCLIHTPQVSVIENKKVVDRPSPPPPPPPPLPAICAHSVLRLECQGKHWWVHWWNKMVIQHLMVTSRFENPS